MREMNRLLEAAAEGNETLVAQFLADGDDPNVQDAHGTTPLIAASTWGFAGIIEKLLEAGADSTIVMQRNKWTPLHAAASQNHGKVLMMLMNSGADPNACDSMGRSPADFASASQAIWPFFEARGCVRTSSMKLRELGILQEEFEEPNLDGPADTGRFLPTPMGKFRRGSGRLGTASRPGSRGDVLLNTDMEGYAQRTASARRGTHD
ncbi:hypothetical protein CYMTET_22146 [Cymbomonas tetramitiformis]|uniref:Uncharacterized protein n=1 Tax=Cymbomonas tetramitiformis TaxID=36881 RepID=A0AAE0G100_9CHLO|nr:hypothetical protein CYMTET_22146 [Cymbomonas tetramitiformis]